MSVPVLPVLLPLLLLPLLLRRPPNATDSVRPCAPWTSGRRSSSLRRCCGCMRQRPPPDSSVSTGDQGHCRRAE
uniref:Putative secreted protein n=1 Tax=Anopheles darlingi TaxID=43151 RepID=A0A2M4DMH9_ANODA